MDIKDIQAEINIALKQEEKKRNWEFIELSIRNFILENMQIITTRDSIEDILVYDHESGIYVWDGKPILKQMIGEICESISIHRINEIIDKIKRKTYLEREKLDPPNLTAFKNVVLNLENWEFLKHSNEYFLTKRIEVDYKPGIFPERFYLFMNEILEETKHNIILEILAHTLMNDYRYQKAFIFLGEGANGKSTLLNILIKLLGPKNVTSHTLQAFDKNQFAASELYGKMANIAPDISAKGMYQIGVFKSLTGGDYGTFNVKGKKSITFTNTAKLIFSCNKLPPIFEDTHAVWRRLCIIEFEKIIDEKDQNPLLLEVLTTEEELSGILNVLLMNLFQLIQRGEFEGLKSVLDRREQYICKSDIIHAFCDNCLIIDSNGFISSSELYQELCLYARKINATPKTKQSLTKQLQMWIPEAYPTKRKIGNKPIRGWAGIMIKDNWQDDYQNT